MWELDDRTASVHLAGLTAQVNLREPNEGLHNIVVRKEPMPNVAVLQTRIGDEPSGWNDELVDTYVRGADLVAAYAPAPQRNISSQIYWRAIQYDDLEAVGVETIVSVQTDLLDSDPRMTIGSTIPCCDVTRLSDDKEARFELVTAADVNPSVVDSGVGPLLFRLADATYSYVEMIHPADFSAAEIRECTADNERVCSKFRVFNEPLEKGVIRRSRVCGAFIAREGDEQVAVECYRRFVESAVPLTA